MNAPWMNRLREIKSQKGGTPGTDKTDKFEYVSNVSSPPSHILQSNLPGPVAIAKRDLSARDFIPEKGEITEATDLGTAIIAVRKPPGLSESVLELWQERAAILEFDGGMTRPEAEAWALRPRVAQAVRTCDRCVNLNRAFTGGGRYENRTCLEPVAAGLSKKFEIIYPEDDYARVCPAYRPRAIN